MLNIVLELLKYIEPPEHLFNVLVENDYDIHTKTIKCRRCNGEGKHYYFEDRDSYEGYKYADKKQCKTCKGLCRQPVKIINDERKLEVEKYNNSVDNFNKTAIMLSTIRNKLTDRERELLGLVKPIPRLKGLNNAVHFSED